MTETPTAPAPYNLCRTYTTVTVAALRGAGRPDEALKFLADMAQLDGTNRARVATLDLPTYIAESLRSAFR